MGKPHHLGISRTRTQDDNRCAKSIAHRCQHTQVLQPDLALFDIGMDHIVHAIDPSQRYLACICFVANSITYTFIDMVRQ